MNKGQLDDRCLIHLDQRNGPPTIVVVAATYVFQMISVMRSGRSLGGTSSSPLVSSISPLKDAIDAEVAVRGQSSGAAR